jgi:hypothetical protein
MSGQEGRIVTVDQRTVQLTERSGALATDAPANPWESAGLLKPYAGGIVHEAPKVDALATISAGFKNKDGWPEVSRDGTIYVRGGDRAPGLVAELERRGNKSLTLALVHNDPKDVLQQWFATYSKTRLEQHGDEHQITIIRLKNTGQKDRKGNPIMAPERETVRRDADPKRYAMLAADMKVQTSLYFALAGWEHDEPKLIFPDGLGLYRLAFTSLNSAEAIKSQLSYIASLTGGRVAGVPLELSIAYRNLAGPDGVRRDRVPIWSLVLNPPKTIELNPARVASILQSGIEQATSLAIAAPRPETLELAEYEGPDVDLDAARIIDGQVITPSRRDVEKLAGGGPIRDPKRFCADFMMMAKGSSLEEKEDRQNFMIAATNGRTDSLSTFAETASNQAGNQLLKVLADWLRQEAEDRQARGELPRQRPPIDADRAERNRRVLDNMDDEPPASPIDRTVPRTYQQLFGDDAGDPASPAAAREPQAASTASTPEVHASAFLTGAAAVESAEDDRPELVLPEDPDWLRSDERPRMLEAWKAWADVLRRLDPGYEIPDPTRLSGPKLVERLREIVGYTRDTYANLFDRDDESSETDDGQTDDPSTVEPAF